MTPPGGRKSCSQFVTPTNLYNQSSSTEVESAPVQAQGVSPLDWLLNPDKSLSLADRVMARLVQFEAHEVDPHFRDDYRQSFITVSLASKGNTMPFVVASYQMYGLHPDKVWPSILANLKAKLGKEYAQWFDQAGNRKPEIPKKSSLPQSQAKEKLA